MDSEQTLQKMVVRLIIPQICLNSSLVQIARHFDLIGGKLIAGDSTKLRAQNSKKNNFNQAKINRHVAYIDNKLEVYTRSLAENDGDNRQQIEDEINKQQKRKENYKNLEKQLK
jgi:hypothetical protein